MRSTRNSEWALVAGSAAVPAQPAPAVQVNTNIVVPPASSAAMGPSGDGNPTPTEGDCSQQECSAVSQQRAQLAAVVLLELVE